MHWGIPAVLLLIVVLLLIGQWLMKKRARSMERQPVPESLAAQCPGDGLVFFEAPRCPACKQLRPVVESLASEHKVPVCWLNVREFPQIAMDMRIMGTPTLVLVLDGKIQAVRLGGADRAGIESLLAKLPNY